MIAAYEIREQIASYLANRISLNEFEDWLVPNSWNMHRDSDPQSQALASAIELRLAEHSSGHLSEDELRQELVPLVTKYEMPIALGQALLIDFRKPRRGLKQFWLPFVAFLFFTFPPRGVGFLRLVFGTSLHAPIAHRMHRQSVARVTPFQHRFRVAGVMLHWL